MTETPQRCKKMPQEVLKKSSLFCQMQLLFLWLVSISALYSNVYRSKLYRGFVNIK